MKILYTNFHSGDGGGHTTYLVNLIRGLSHVPTVTVAVAAPRTSRLYQSVAAQPAVQCIDIPFSTRGLSLFAERTVLKRAIVQGQFDIIHVNGSADHRLVMLATLGMARRPAIVFTKHNDLSLYSLGHMWRARFSTDSVIAVSTYVDQLLHASPYRHLPITLVYHGIDTDYFAPCTDLTRRAMRAHFWGALGADKIVLGSVAGTHDQKGWFDLLKGLALLPFEARQRFRVLIIGKPPDADKIAQIRAQGLQDYVVFPGLLNDIRLALAACDVGFVLSYREALSFACRESMALGLPMLVSNAGGLSENVSEGQDGWVVPVGDSQAIAGVLRWILQNPEQVAAMGAAARAKSVREFGVGQFVEKTRAVYDSVFKSTSERTAS